PLRLAADGIGMSPEHLAGFGRKACDAVRMPNDELAPTVHGVNDGRRIADLARVERTPEFLAGVLVKRDDGAVGAAHEADEPISLEQRMRGVTPHGRFVGE